MFIWSWLKGLFGKTSPVSVDGWDDVVVASGPMPEFLRNKSLPRIDVDEDEDEDDWCDGCEYGCFWCEDYDEDDSDEDWEDEDDDLCPECGFELWICDCDDFDDDDEGCFGDEDCSCCCCTGTCG